MGFPSPAADYQESALNLNEIMISHPSATILVPTTNGWLLVDKSISPARGNQVYFLLWARKRLEFCGTTQLSVLMEKKYGGSAGGDSCSQRDNLDDYPPWDREGPTI